MKKVLLTLALLLAALCAGAQNIQMAEEIPAGAADILRPRLAQMLEAGGITLSGDDSLRVSACIMKRVETPGGQVALEIELKTALGEADEVFPIKGVGDNDEDAWSRAVKQFLPRSKNAQKFIEKLKQ